MIKKFNIHLQFINKRGVFKLKASTIVETLVASLIIVIIFSIASLTLNNVFKSIIKKDTTLINYRLNKLNYLLQNDKLSIPYFEEYKNWNISIQKSNNETYYNLEILAIRDKQEINKTVVYGEY